MCTHKIVEFSSQHQFSIGTSKNILLSIDLPTRYGTHYYFLYFIFIFYIYFFFYFLKKNYYYYYYRLLYGQCSRCSRSVSRTQSLYHAHWVARAP
jgi:hypothetical protein